MVKTADIKDISHIPKLTGDNYQVWKFQMLIVFNAKDLISVLEPVRKPDIKGKGSDISSSSSSSTPPFGSSPDITDLARRDFIAQMYITASCDEKRLQQIINCTSAYDM